MADFQQFPGELNIACSHVDALTITGSLGFPTTGDTLLAVVYEDTDAGYAATLANTPTYAASWSITRVNDATGSISLALAANTIKSLSVAKRYRWYLRSANLARAVTSGTFAVRAP